MKRALLWAVTLAALLPACFTDGEGEGDAAAPPPSVYGRGSLDRNPGFPGAAGDPDAFDPYFEADAYGTKQCDTVIRDLGHRREIRVFFHPGDFDVEPFTRGLQRYYRRFGVEFYMRHVPLEVPIDWVADTDTDAMMVHLRGKFPDVDWESSVPPPDDVLEAVFVEGFTFTVGPMIDFAAAYGDQGDAITNLVLLPRVERNESLETAAGQDRILLGLAISPTLLTELADHPASEDARFWRYFPLHEPFTPMVFLNAGVLSALPGRGIDEVIIDLTVAHEVGHTFGLQHLEQPGNLMYPGFESTADIVCESGLDAEQVDRIDRTLQASAVGQSTQDLRLAGDQPALWRRLREHLAGRAPTPFLRP